MVSDWTLFYSIPFHSHLFLMKQPCPHAHSNMDDQVSGNGFYYLLLQALVTEGSVRAVKHKQPAVLTEQLGAANLNPNHRLTQL